MLMGFASYMFWFRKAGSVERDSDIALVGSVINLQSAAEAAALADGSVSDDIPAIGADVDDCDITTATTT